MILAIAVPIMVQNGITNFVSMIDNIMVGRVGTNEMSGVAIVNQLIMVFNLCIFGGVAGAGIFTAQFHGARNTEGIRYTFRYKIIVVAIITVLSIAIFLGFGEELIRLYLHGESGAEEAITGTLHNAKVYLSVMLIGLPPFAISQAYGDYSTYEGRSCLCYRQSLIKLCTYLWQARSSCSWSGRCSHCYYHSKIC